ncbi:hypothetical protein [Roseovarius sp. SYSU LYC5161]|uniref:hypothetical protein n=1 Tax=Roseovarius halophilus (ex Wu et al. 2025) TaxID=3376060 RepID=UPI00399B0FD3
MRCIPLLSFVLTGTLSASISVAEQDLPPVEDLTDGIRAFICDVEEVAGSTPIILVLEEGQWRISGFKYDQIAKIDNGYRIKSSYSENMLGFLLEEMGGWKLYFQDEHGQSASACQPMDDFTNTFVTAIAPKLFENADNVQMTSTEEELFSEIERLKQRNEQLIKNSRMWQDRIAELERQIQEK